mmetsp:Transcript_19423/g.29795  ORF Transcript_19423/g.29795 Transcript_19423/m.29795 type:complete len:82 (-) Transcript_19423:236-481(-)
MWRLVAADTVAAARADPAPGAHIHYHCGGSGDGKRVRSSGACWVGGACNRRGSAGSERYERRGVFPEHNKCAHGCPPPMGK